MELGDAMAADHSPYSVKAAIYPRRGLHITTSDDDARRI
jgi:hypothetical protein